MITSFQHYHRLLEYVIPHWKMLVLAFFSMTVLALTLSALPALILFLLDTIVYKNHALTQLALLAILTLFVIYSAMKLLNNKALNKVGSELATDLRLAMFKKLLALPEQYLQSLNDKKIKTRFITDLNLLTQALSNITTVLVKDSLTVIGLLVWMFYLHQEFTLLILLVSALMVIITQLITEISNHVNAQFTRKTKQFANDLQNTVKNYKTIWLHGGQLQESERLIKHSHQTQHAYMKQAAANYIVSILAQFFAVIIFSAIGYLTLQQVYSRELSTGEAGSFIFAALMLVMPLKQIFGIHEQCKQGQQKLKSIFAFLDKEAKTETGVISINRAKGELVFEHISYYQEKLPLLKNVTLTIRPGETVAFIDICEENKAVLIDLILGFCQPRNGRILLDGHDVASLTSTSLYDNITLLSKNITIFDDTVAANIAYGKTRCANEASITAAAQRSHATTFIREMPEGLQTLLGKNGVELTEPQRLYIGIARALLTDTPVLILDEIPAMSKPDSNDLHDALETLMQERTTLLFTQQPPVHFKISRLITMKNGYIEETESYPLQRQPRASH